MTEAFEQLAQDLAAVDYPWCPPISFRPHIQRACVLVNQSQVRERRLTESQRQNLSLDRAFLHQATRLGWFRLATLQEFAAYKDLVHQLETRARAIVQERVDAAA